MSAKVWTEDRMAALKSRRDQGETLRALAESYGRSSETIRQRLLRYERILARREIEREIADEEAKRKAGEWVTVQAGTGSKTLYETILKRG